jgi:hypothetical protein
MLASLFRSRGGTALATLAVAACASTGTPPSQESVTRPRVPSLTPTSRVIDADRIQRSGAQTAWDAVRLLVPSYRFQPNRGSALGMLAIPGARHVDSSVRLVIDGHRLADLDALRAIPAREILAIHVLSATEASIHLGPVSSSGAIVVQTRAALRQL